MKLFPPEVFLLSVLLFFLIISVHTVPFPLSSSYLIMKLHGLKILLAAVIKPKLSKMQI
jgi:hypothetical protein